MRNFPKKYSWVLYPFLLPWTTLYYKRHVLFWRGTHRFHKAELCRSKGVFDLCLLVVRTFLLVSLNDKIIYYVCIPKSSPSRVLSAEMIDLFTAQQVKKRTIVARQTQWTESPLC